MASAAIVDSGFLVAVIANDDRHHAWAASEATKWPAPWKTTEAVISESFFVAGPRWRDTLVEFIERGTVAIAFDLQSEMTYVLALMRKYRNVPMSLADACVVRMTELLRDPVVLTMDSDFSIYRRNGRHVIPTRMPPKISATRRRR